MPGFIYFFPNILCLSWLNSVLWVGTPPFLKSWPLFILVQLNHHILARFYIFFLVKNELFSVKTKQNKQQKAQLSYFVITPRLIHCTVSLTSNSMSEFTKVAFVISLDFLCCHSTVHLFVGQRSWTIAIESLKFQTPCLIRSECTRNHCVLNFFHPESNIYFVWLHASIVFQFQTISLVTYAPKYELHLTFVSQIYAFFFFFANQLREKDFCAWCTSGLKTLAAVTGTREKI